MKKKDNKVLNLPASYAAISEEEMLCLDSGWCLERKWWGYNLYLTHKERQDLTTIQAIAGVIAGIAGTAVAAALVGGVATIIWNYDDGYGVRVRLTGNATMAVMTGVYSLTKKQEKNIASKNTIIW